MSVYDNDGYETGMYFDRGPAEAAVDRLHGLGYGQNDIGVMMDDKTRERAFASLTNVKGSEGVATGATIGGVLGAIVAGLTATGSVAAIAGTGVWPHRSSRDRWSQRLRALVSARPAAVLSAA